MNPTQKSALAAARRRWGRRAFVRENRGVMSPAVREAVRRRVAALRDQYAAADAAIKALAHDWQKLLAAAEFFLSVNGDEPSGTQFREAVATSRRSVDLHEEREALRREIKQQSSGLHLTRWEAGYIQTLPGLGDCVAIHEHGDTLAELVERIRGAKHATTGTEI